jgi:hypothetical protein
MNVFDRLSFFFALVLIAITCGCEAAKQKAVVQEPSDRLKIVPGAGVKGAFVGMEIAEAQKNFTPLPKSDTGINHPYEFVSKDGGFFLAGDKQRIRSITFAYVLKEWPELSKSFSGQTKEGIGAGATIEKVIKVYGQPETIYATENEKGKDVTLDYMGKGILFDFHNGRLRIIAVNAKQAATPRDHDIGDTSEYRAIAPGNASK